MTTEQLELRVSSIEKTVADLQRQISQLARPTRDNWLPSVLGRFKENPDYDEIVRLGREFREGRLAEDNDPPDPATS